jgi:hypothetical protein
VGSWPLRAYEENSFADWFLHCPIPQPGSFWTAGLHALPGVREDLHYYFDYEFWAAAAVRPRAAAGAAGPRAGDLPPAPGEQDVANNRAFHVEGRMIPPATSPR